MLLNTNVRPDLNRSHYDILRYPINPAVLFPRASRPRPEKQPMGTIELGNNNVHTPLNSAASLLKNEFTQNFDDIAKIQRQEVNAIKGMNMDNQAPPPSVVNMPGQAIPGAEVLSVPGQGSTPGLVTGNEASALPVQEQGQQPEVVPVSPQQSMASFAPVPQNLPASGRAVPAQIAPRAPIEIAPGFVRGNPLPAVQNPMVQAQRGPEPAVQFPQAAVQSPEPAVQASRKSPFTEVPLQQLPQLFQPQLPLPGMQIPFLPPAELPPPGELHPPVEVAPPAELPPQVVPAEVPLAPAYVRPVFNPIPRPDADDSDRPSINIQVQTSKSRIPKLKTKKKDTKDNKKKTH